jgi:hypothetical protein
VDLLPNLLLGVEIATATFGGLAMTESGFLRSQE